MEITLDSIIGILGLLFGGGAVGGIFTWRWQRARAKAEAKEKEVEVCTSGHEAYQVGQEVMLEGRLSDGRKAAMIAYGLPLLLLLPVLFISIRLTGSDTVGALCGLGVIVLYYLCIYLFFRKRLQQQFSFAISLNTKP